MPTSVKPTDEVVEDKGVKILVDPKAVLFLLGTEMDYKAEKLSAQFVFNNPNQTGACGCGENRVQLTPPSAASSGRARWRRAYPRRHARMLSGGLTTDGHVRALRELPPSDTERDGER